MDHFFLFYYLQSLKSFRKSKFCKKWKTMPGDLVMYTINEDQMIYGSWNIKLSRHNVLSFWIIFCPLIPLTTRKIKFWKIEKTTWRYYHFTHLPHKWQSRDVWSLRNRVWQTKFFVTLDCFLSLYPPTPPLPPMDQDYQNFEKWKKHLKILSFYKCVQ